MNCRLNTTVRSSKEEKQNELKAAFSLFDLDEDGKISLEEFGVICHELGLSLSEKDLITIAKESSVDCVNKGYISFEDFSYVMNSKLNDSDTEKELKEAFKVFDREGNGYFTSKELRFVMSKIANVLTEEQIDTLINKIDQNGDGQVDFDEFIAMMMNK